MNHTFISQDLAVFIGSVILLIGYLIFSAKTEMGTKIISQPRQTKQEQTKQEQIK